MSTPPPLQTRKPTGLPSYPIGLIAGVEKSGKTLKCVEASASDLINNTYWIGCGEDDPDEYGAFEGAKFDIVLHDGTYRGTLNAIEAASAQPAGEDGRPNLLVFDSGTRGWDMLKDMAQASQHERFIKRAEKYGDSTEIPEAGIKPTGDLWNTANDRWDHIVNALRAHNGPVLITARLENQVVIGDDGQPTKDRHWKVISQKYLPYDVGFIVQMRGSYPEVDNYLTGVRSLRYKHETVKSGKDRGKVKVTPLADDFTIDSIWRNLGIHETVSARVHAHIAAVGDVAEVEQRKALLDELMEYVAQLGVSTADVAAQWATTHNGQRIDQTSDLAGLARVRDHYRQRAADAPTQTEPTENAQPVADGDPGAPVEVKRAPEPGQSAPAPVTREAKHLALVRDELTYQAQVLGIPWGNYAEGLVNAEGGVDFGKAQKYAVQQRAKVIAHLRQVGEATIAARYEGYGDSPLLVIEQVVAGGDYQREAAPQGQRA